MFLAVVEIGGSLFAAYGLVFGMGILLVRGWHKGVCQIGYEMVWHVYVPLTFAVAFRAVVLTAGGSLLFAVVDIVTMLIMMGTIGQHFGLFFKHRNRR